MASHFEITSNFPRFHEHRPMMLKDFLRDDSFNSCTSSSSPNGFPMYPKNSAVLLRSRSKKAAATTISAVVNVVKFLQFASAKAPSVLPHSISRKLLTKSRKDKKDIFRDHHVSEVKEKVKVKDILRWKSFRDLVEDDCTPLDLPPSPNRSTTTAATDTTTTTTTTTTSCSKRSSWCESDFTAEELPPWGGENEEFLGKKCNFLGNPPTFRNHKGEYWSFEEYEQQSPVSVLDSPFREVLHQDSISPFHPILANVERTRCMLTRRFQELESNTDPKYSRTHSFGEKAKQLLSHVQQFNNNGHDYDVISDFFMHELSINGNLGDFEFDSHVLKVAKSWINDEYDESYDWEFKDKRESYVKDMEKGVCWKKFKQEQQELSEELEVRVFAELIEEILDEFSS